MQAQQLEHINNEAREWFTLMQSGSVSDTEYQQWQAWLNANSVHQQAYHQYDIIWQDLGKLAGSKELAALQRTIKPGIAETLHNIFETIVTNVKNVQIKSQFAMALVSVAIIGALVVGLQPEKIHREQFSTLTGEVKQFTLPDGSQITLGAKSQINAWATTDERHVELINGQAFFKIAKNPQRPFFVDAGETRVRVVGTQFDVRKGLDRTRVAVLEGIVKVSSSNTANTDVPVVLTAGLQVTHLNAGHFEAVNNISVSELESWRNGRLMYLRASLADVVADANRYFNGSISLGSKNLADLKVTAAVSTDQVDSLTDLLSKSLPISVRKDANNHIVILSRDDAEKPQQ